MKHGEEQHSDFLMGVILLLATMIVVALIR
jgi:hypothetical protein